jgi:hypothetical protein
MGKWILKVGVPLGVLFFEIRVKRLYRITQDAKRFLIKTNTCKYNRWLGYL